MMDALISTFVEELRRRAAQYPDDLQGHMLDHGTDVDGTVPQYTILASGSLSISIISHSPD